MSLVDQKPFVSQWNFRVFGTTILTLTRVDGGWLDSVMKESPVQAWVRHFDFQ